MRKEIEIVKLYPPIVDSPITVYKTPKTKKYDEEFNSPMELYGKIKGKMTMWNFTGNKESEESLDVLLSLCSELGYFVAITKKDFMKGIPRYAWNDCLSMERIEVGRSKDIGSLVLISEKALKYIEDIN